VLLQELLTQIFLLHHHQDIRGIEINTMGLPNQQISMEYEDGQLPLLLSFLGIITFNDFLFEREYVILRPKKDASQKLLALFLRFLRQSTGKEFFFELDQDSHQLILRCLNDRQFFPKIIRKITP
jgi:hypothetical protein